MSNSQIFLQFFGWGLLIYLHSRTLRRAEISRLKDAIVKQLSDFVEKIKSEIKKDKVDFLVLEEEVSAKSTQIEFKIKQLNSYSRLEIVSPSKIASLRNIALENIKDKSLVEKTFNDVENDLIEHIESQYIEKMFKTNFFRHLYINRRPEIWGALFPLIILVLFFKILDFFFSFI